MIIVCREELKESIKRIFTETLLGPRRDQIYHMNDFPVGSDTSIFPNFEVEGCYLDPARKVMKIKDLIQFSTFSSHGIAKVPDSEITIKSMKVGQQDIFRVRGLDKAGKIREICEIPEDIREKVDAINDEKVSKKVSERGPRDCLMKQYI